VTAPLVAVTSFEASVGKRIRLVLAFENTLRPLLWLRVGRDGSIYLGPGRAKSGESRLYRRRALIKNSTASLNLQDLPEPFHDDPNIVESAKLSFHVSGATHSPGGRTWSAIPMRGLNGQIMVANVLFRNPRELREIETLRSNDYVCHFTVNEACPLQGYLLAAPPHAAQIHFEESFSNQANLGLLFRGLTEFPELGLQFVLGHGDPAPWPPVTWIMYIGSEETQSPYQANDLGSAS